MMCGIAGIVARAPIDDRQPLRAMLKALYHRGPDGEGELTDGHLAMGMRRLSIIDLKGGWQPLYNENRAVGVVANGEIYNHVELRKELEQKGHRFKTSSDCETIAHLYEEDGVQCVRRLRGMFAFALWDRQRNTLLLARDRMGEKPLYIYEERDRLWFASEIKALLAAGAVPFALDKMAINAYLHYGYVPEPWTMLKGVRKLSAAHVLTIDLESWKIAESPYWDMEEAPPIEGDPAQCIRAALEEISELVIRSDVPVGVALSGGMDSSIIAALAARKYRGNMAAFSIGYPGRPSYDERAAAHALAGHLDMPFYEAELSSGDLAAFFPELVKWADDPIADISAYGYFAVMKLAGEHKTPVVLQGHGGDELFWGYPWVRQALLESRLKSGHGGNGAAFLETTRRLLPLPFNRRGVRRWLQSACGLKEAMAFRRRLSSYPPGRMIFYDLTDGFAFAGRQDGALFGQDFLEAFSEPEAARWFSFNRPWPREDIRITRLICDLYLRGNGIAQGDRLGMASSVEMRLPFADHKLVETVIGLRKASPDDALPPKYWLALAARDIVPDFVFQRPKRGFQPPSGDWKKAVFKAHGKTLEEGYLAGNGILSPAAARVLARAEFTDNDEGGFAYYLLVLETWCREMSVISAGAGNLAPGNVRDICWRWTPGAGKYP